jgi:UDP-N-acetylmuramate dehydrogenase
METSALRTLVAEELKFGYRSSSIVESDVVTSVELLLSRGASADGDAALREIVRWRREHQPGGANCGSVFTNPPGDSAGRLIEAAGLKGFRLGSVCVSPKHANFIQADSGAKASDVWALIAHIQITVAERFGVVLHAEVKTLGEFPDRSSQLFSQSNLNQQPQHVEPENLEAETF